MDAGSEDRSSTIKLLLHFQPVSIHDPVRTAVGLRFRTERNMPDKKETELKFIIAKPEAFRAMLVASGAVSKGRHSEENIRLDDRDRGLSRRKVVLRLRRTEH